MRWRRGLLVAAVATVGITACQVPGSTNPAMHYTLPATSSASPVAQPSLSPHPGVTTAPSVDAVITAPLLFAASRDGRTTYLLGTLHRGVDATHQLPPWVWHYFNTATALVMEADANDPALQRAMVRSDGSTLRNELGDATWHRLERALGADAAYQLNDLPVPMATMAIALTGLPETQAMDATLAAAADVLHKPIMFLEPMTVQVRLATKWLDASALTSMLDDFALVPQRNRELLVAYLHGELSGLTQVVSDGRSDFARSGRPVGQYDTMMTELLGQRNRMWVPVVEQLHRAGLGIAANERTLGAGPTFIAVGALHLTGPDGLLALLNRRGFIVTQLKQP